MLRPDLGPLVPDPFSPGDGGGAVSGTPAGGKKHRRRERGALLSQVLAPRPGRRSFTTRLAAPAEQLEERLQPLMHDILRDGQVLRCGLQQPPGCLSPAVAHGLTAGPRTRGGSVGALRVAGDSQRCRHHQALACDGANSRRGALRGPRMSLNGRDGHTRMLLVEEQPTAAALHPGSGRRPSRRRPGSGRSGRGSVPTARRSVRIVASVPPKARPTSSRPFLGFIGTLSIHQTEPSRINGPMAILPNQQVRRSPGQARSLGLFGLSPDTAPCGTGRRALPPGR
jgi:hypothetical protein